MLRTHSDRCRQSLQLRGGHGRTAGRFATRCSFGVVNLDQVALSQRTCWMIFSWFCGRVNRRAHDKCRRT